MKKVCARLLCALLFCALFITCGMTTFGREVERPEDASKNYLTVLGDVNETDAQWLKAQLPSAHFNHYKSNDPLIERYRATVGEFPAVVYQEPSGLVVHKLSGKNFPSNPKELTGFVEQCRPFRPKPEPTNPVTPTQPTPPTFTPPVVPDTPANDGGILGYIIAALLGAAGTAGYTAYKEISGKK